MTNSFRVQPTFRIDEPHPVSELVATAISRVFPGTQRQIRCHVRARQVCLTGTVESFYQKQIAQEALLQMEQIQQVVNLLQVQRPSR